MTVLIEDTPRNNLTAWTIEGFTSGVVSGAVISPFSTPAVGNSYKPSGQSIAADLAGAGCEVWFDAATHALQMPGVGDFRYYEGWDLWGGATGELLSRGLQRDHVLRVLEIQASLGARPLGPTVLLTSASGAQLSLAYSLAEATREAISGAYVTLAGTSTFWSGGDDLDAFIGAIAQLGAAGYSLIVVRATTDLPATTSVAEISGLCRTSRSLEPFGAVHISHGDLAALPAVAAGASSVGSGWDTRQRVCGFTSYEARDPAGGGGGWFKRPTFSGLLGFLSRSDAERLATQNAALSTRIHPGQLHPDGPKEAFLHHATCLSGVITELTGLDYEERFRALEARYVEAASDWPAAAQAASAVSAADAWVLRPLAGLRNYGQTEGWT